MTDRNHHFPPKDAPTCILCSDGGFNKHTGQWQFCLCPAGEKERAKDPKACESMNQALESLESRLKR